MEIRLNEDYIGEKVAEAITDLKKYFIDAMRTDLMKLQTYKMFPYDRTEYVKRDDVMKILEKYTEGGEGNADSN